MRSFCGQQSRTFMVTSLLLVAGVASADDLKQRVDACAGIGDDGARLACFDALATPRPAAQTSTGNDDTVAAAVPVQATATEVTPVADDDATPTTSPAILPPAPAGDEAKENAEFSVQLTHCAETSATRRQIYYFDNGEVWEQSNNDKNKVRDCNTPVTVEKAMFGYKMRVPGQKRSIRIRPVR